MKKILLILFLLLCSPIAFGQEFTSGPLFNIVKGPYDITGDSTLTITWDFQPLLAPNKKVSGFFEYYLLVDSVNGTGSFNSSDSSDMELKHRLRVAYAITGSATNRTQTYYITNNDSVAVFTDATLVVGIQNFDFSFDEADGWQMEHDFSVTDTMRVWYILKAAGKP